ncbi:MAG: 4Fe-4S dicluster domain-containing protein [Candidatus Symbiothrix sp.]|jgi:2-oxoglutarate ferredoxin oxidoreductase subunit delta|nr:4Fe-4S dicluster domain-containing protein [Candidatus Symbiothrix sp.]
MAKIKGTVVVNTSRCKGCDLCVVACPTDVLVLSKEVNTKGYHYVQMQDGKDCIGCINCGLVCPDGCLAVYKVKIANEEPVAQKI